MNHPPLQLTPQTIKPAVTKRLIEMTAPIQKMYQESKEWQEITLKAYPPAELKKKDKKVKNKGTRHPIQLKEGSAPETEAIPETTKPVGEAE